MSKNTQALILFFASQVTWAVCCIATAPAFIATTYDETALMWILMLNGLAIVSASSLLMLVAILVAMSKSDELSPKKLDPKFSIAMGLTVFMLIGQVVLSVTHAHLQPDDDEIVAPAVDVVDVFEFEATLADGQIAGGAYGYVIPHPADGRAVFVTVSSQFGEAFGLDADLSVSDIQRQVESAYVVPVGSPNAEPIELGAPIAFEADALFASGYGTEDVMSDVLFFEAPNLRSQMATTHVYDGLQEAPIDQKLFAVTEHASVVTLEFGADYADIWEVEVSDDAGVIAGTPILNWKYEVVGHMTWGADGIADVFPLHLAHDYLGSPVR